MKNKYRSGFEEKSLRIWGTRKSTKSQIKNPRVGIWKIRKNVPGYQSVDQYLAEIKIKVRYQVPYRTAGIPFWFKHAVRNPDPNPGRSKWSPAREKLKKYIMKSSLWGDGNCSWSLRVLFQGYQIQNLFLTVNFVSGSGSGSESDPDSAQPWSGLDPDSAQFWFGFTQNAWFRETVSKWQTLHGYLHSYKEHPSIIRDQRIEDWGNIKKVLTSADSSCVLRRYHKRY